MLTEHDKEDLRYSLEKYLGECDYVDYVYDTKRYAVSTHLSQMLYEYRTELARLDSMKTSEKEEEGRAWLTTKVEEIREEMNLRLVANAETAQRQANLRAWNAGYNADLIGVRDNRIRELEESIWDGAGNFASRMAGLSLQLENEPAKGYHHKVRELIDRINNLGWHEDAAMQYVERANYLLDALEDSFKSA